MQNFSLKNIRICIDEFDRRLAELNSCASFAEKAESLVKNAVDSALDDLVQKKLDGAFLGRLDLDPETILKLTQKNATEVSKLIGASESVLVNAYSIPSSEAKKIVDYIAELHENVRQSVNIKLNVDDKNAQSTNLLTVLYIYRNALPIAEECASLLKEHESKIQQNVDALRPYGNAVKYVATLLFNKEAKTAFKALDEIYQSPFWNRSAELVLRFKTITSVDSSQVWNDFSKTPIPFFTDLEKICPYAMGNAEDELGNLPKEILDERTNLDGLKAQLRHYQVLGVKFILHQGRVLLGDEMGLGKTVEAIAAMVTLWNLGESHFLVICPASILVNWLREIEKMCEIPALKIHGQEKFTMLDNWKKNGGIAVTTYETSRQLNFADNEKISMLVVDEAHYVKNPGSQRTASVRKICGLSERLLLMTGTALENRTKEMLFLLELLRPQIAKMAKGFATESSSYEFLQIVAPIYYRRKREEVLKELPELIEQESWIVGGENEMEAYEKAALQEQFMAMRRVSFNVDDLEQSGKLARIAEIVKQAKFEERKILVFSFFLDTIEKVCDFMGDCCMEPITGAVSVGRRQEIIDAFEKAPAGTVLPLQINAGGLGLNIQAANVVILCEPQLKPSAEMQAISRAYRMGQVRNVLVYRLLMLHSIDEEINTLLKYKTQVFNTFADKSISGKQDLEVNPDEIKDLFKKEVERIRKAKGSVVPTEKDLFLENVQLLERKEKTPKNEFGYCDNDVVSLNTEFMRKTCEWYNELYFGGKLNVERLSFATDRAESRLACFVPSTYSVVFSRQFEFDYRKYRNTMVHEMCHCYLWTFAPESDPYAGVKHGKAFQDLVDKLNSEHHELNVMLKDCDDND